MLGEHSADRLDPEAVPVSVDEGDHFGDWRSSSAPKKWAAAFKISFARRSSLTSRSSSAHPGPLIRRQPWPLPSIGLGPPDPLTQRLRIDRQLRRDRLDRLPLRRVLTLVLEHHPHRIFEDGAAPQNQVVRLDLTDNVWTLSPSPPIALKNSVDVIAAGPRAIIVGQNENPNGCAALHILTDAPADDTWDELDSTPVTARSDVVATWTGSELFIGGGVTCTNGVADPTLLPSAHLLNPDTGKWRTAALAPAGYYSSYRYSDGWTGASITALDPNGAPLLYNPTTDSWHQGPPLDPARPVGLNQTPVAVTPRSILISGQLTASWVMRRWPRAVGGRCRHGRA